MKVVKPKLSGALYKHLGKLGKGESVKRGHSGSGNTELDTRQSRIQAVRESSRRPKNFKDSPEEEKRVIRLVNGSPDMREFPPPANMAAATQLLNRLAAKGLDLKKAYTPEQVYKALAPDMGMDPNKPPKFLRTTTDETFGEYAPKEDTIGVRNYGKKGTVELRDLAQIQTLFHELLHRKQSLDAKAFAANGDKNPLKRVGYGKLKNEHFIGAEVHEADDPELKKDRDYNRRMESHNGKDFVVEKIRQLSAADYLPDTFYDPKLTGAKHALLRQYGVSADASNAQDVEAKFAELQKESPEVAGVVAPLDLRGSVPASWPPQPLRKENED